MKFFISFIKFLGIILIPIFIVIIIYGVGDYILYNDCCICGASNGCCPCPNEEYFDEVVEWSGNRPCGSGCYLMMCEDYKKEMNKTFVCFE